MSASRVRLYRRPWRVNRSAPVITTPGAADAWDREHLMPTPGSDMLPAALLAAILAPVYRPQFQDPLATWWFDAPLPRRLHRCRPWTSAEGCDRCACGAIKPTTSSRWSERNSRRPRR